MKSLLNLGQRFLTDEKAAEVTELSIVLALVVASSVVLIVSIGNAVKNQFTTVSSAL